MVVNEQNESKVTGYSAYAHTCTTCSIRVQIINTLTSDERWLVGNFQACTFCRATLRAVSEVNFVMFVISVQCPVTACLRPAWDSLYYLRVMCVLCLNPSTQSLILSRVQSSLLSPYKKSIFALTLKLSQRAQICLHAFRFTRIFDYIRYEISSHMPVIS